MLQNFIICVNAVVPSAIYLLIGIIIRVTHVLSDEDVKKFTHMLFVSMYGILMFDNLYGKDFSGINISLGLFALGFTIFQYIVAWGFVCRIEKDDRDRSVMIQGLYRSNFVLMGIPIATNLFGRGNITPIAVVMLLIVPFYNISAVILFEYFRGGRTNPRKIIKGILTNPIIDGAIVALIFIVLKIRLPEVVTGTIDTLADATSPMALILLGASLNAENFSSDKKKIAICTTGKLFVFPAIGLSLAVMLGLRGVSLIAVALMMITPDALSSYAMASSMNANGKLAGELVVVTTLLSCFTMPIWLFILKTNGMF